MRIIQYFPSYRQLFAKYSLCSHYTLQSYCLVFKIDQIMLLLVHYYFGLLQSIKRGSFTNLETWHNNVVHARRLLRYFSTT